MTRVSSGTLISNDERVLEVSLCQRDDLVGQSLLSRESRSASSRSGADSQLRIRLAMNEIADADQLRVGPLSR